MIYNYRYNYRALYKDVSRETQKILYMDSIVSYTYIYIIAYQIDRKTLAQE